MLILFPFPLIMDIQIQEPETRSFVFKQPPFMSCADIQTLSLQNHPFQEYQSLTIKIPQYSCTLPSAAQTIRSNPEPNAVSSIVTATRTP